MKLADFAFDSAGNALAGATVEIYVSGSVVQAQPSITTDSNGYWEFNALSPGTTYDVKISGTDNHGIALVYWRKGAVDVQVDRVYGLTSDGAAPVDDASITLAKLAANAVSDNQLTIDPSSAQASNTGMLKALLGKVAGQLQAILGTSDWFGAPGISLAALVTHAARHKSGGVDPLSYADIGAAALNHTHDPSQIGGTAAHTHDGSQITSDVTEAKNSLALGGIAASQSIYLYGASTDGASWGPTSGPWKIVTGSFAGTTDGLGQLTITFPTAFTSIKNVFVLNGSWNAFQGIVHPKVSTNANVTIQAWRFVDPSTGQYVSQPAPNQNVRVNYWIVGL